MSTYFDKSKNLRDLADDIASHLARTNGGHDVSNEPRVPKGSGQTSGEWTQTGDTPSGTRVALDWLGKQMAKSYIKDFRNLLNSLTNGALSQEQLDSLVHQIMQNLSDTDGLALKSLAGAAAPMEVSPKQKQIIQHQIDQLSPDLRDTVQNAFDRANANGTLVCPKCTG